MSNLQFRLIPTNLTGTFQPCMVREKMVAATTYTVCKLPKPIETFRIRSTDVALEHGLTKFIDIVTKKVYVGAMNHSYATETKNLG